jgi:putative ATP-grasp target RiPP
MPLLTSNPAPTEFADDPIASHSAQFGLARPTDIPASYAAPSPVGVRPWNLRAAQPLGRRAGVISWRYDHDRQVAVTPDGRPLTASGDATADSVSTLDGDEGPSEDWTYDFHPDSPGSPV